ncbi:hypothetical protein [Alicyclobacillus kakegawensis]|uniref:hypothetical protein n=1 Tax=Alicyclobacillus kakegawensis TaxID=392012 RepID=UPI00083614A0|nr:hypothetical protein [Alicyclobacillus kakegawensis]
MEAQIPDESRSSSLASEVWAQGLDLAIDWVPFAHMKSRLRRLAREWQDEADTAAQDTLALVRWEVWEAECGLAPHPEVAVARVDGRTCGVLSGYSHGGWRCFFVSHLAVATRSHPPLAPRVRQALLTAAIDRSIELGWHGWVASEPAKGEEELWRELGFRKYDDFTYRRMGYFH